MVPREPPNPRVSREPQTHLQLKHLLAQLPNPRVHPRPAERVARKQPPRSQTPARREPPARDQPRNEDTRAQTRK